jgi:hypothetical protein
MWLFKSVLFYRITSAFEASTIGTIVSITVFCVGCCLLLGPLLLSLLLLALLISSSSTTNYGT